MLRAAHSQLTRAALAAPCASPALRRAFADAPAAFVTAAQVRDETQVRQLHPDR
jgi:hypothetical protein